MQLLLRKMPIFRALASFKEEQNLRRGQVVSRPYPSRLVGAAYTRNSTFTAQDLTDTNEQLTVNTATVIPFRVDKFDRLQHEYDVVSIYSQEASSEMRNILDGVFLAETANANYTVDDADFGGTSGLGVTATSSNIPQVFTKAALKLDGGNVPMEGRFATISPNIKAILIDYLGGKESALGDSTGQNGHIGKYGGFELYQSNATYWTGVLAMATNPTNADTITITFVDTLSAASGATEVHIASTVDITRANLVEFLNAHGATSEAEATDTGYSSADATKAASGYSEQDLLRNITATNDNSANTATLVAKGEGVVVTSEGLTATADVWTVGKEIQYLMFGKKGMVDMVVQSRPEIDEQKINSSLVTEYVANMLYGIKTFNYGARNLCQVKVNSSSF